MHVSNTRHVGLTLSLFGLSLVIACFVDQLGLVMSITGNVTAVSIAFILPPICAIESKRRMLKSCLHPAVEGQPSGNQVGLLASDENDVHSSPCSACKSAYRRTLLRNSVVLAFGTFTLFFCTAQTILSA